MRWPLVAALAVGLPAVAQAQANQKVLAAGDEYGKCVQRAALALSVGPDAADLIAKTAVLYCEDEGRAVALAWGAGQENINTGIRYLEHLEKGAVQLATRAILQQRAANAKK